MGSFPNIVASQLLKAIFVTPFSSGTSAIMASGVCSLYNSDNATVLSGATQGGFFTATAAGSQPLYLGLIEHANVTANGAVLTANLSDAIIQSTSGTVASATTWIATTGNAAGASAELIADGYDRKLFTATLSVNPAVDSNTTAAVQLPVSLVNFGTIANYTGSAGGFQKGIVGFFISSFAAKTTGAGIRPHVIAYGVLSNARTLQNGDQPTFAVNAITITLD